MSPPDVVEEGIEKYSSTDSGLEASIAEAQALAIELAKKGVEEAPEIAEILLKAQGSDLAETEVAVLEK